MTDQIIEGLKIIAYRDTKGTEYAADEHVAQLAIAEIERLQAELLRGNTCFNATIQFTLQCGTGDGGMEFLRAWNEGDFKSIKNEWPDAPREVFLADPLHSTHN